MYPGGGDAKPCLRSQNTPPKNCHPERILSQLSREKESKDLHYPFASRLLSLLSTTQTSQKF
jgi:hypothetical protein